MTGTVGRPQHLRLNSDSTKLSVISVSDSNSILSILDLESNNDGGEGSAILNFERKDAWDVMWADDNPNVFAVMEKTRMYVFRDLQPEEPILSSGYLSKFSDLQIQAVMLDDIMATPDAPDKEMVLDFETKVLRDARDLITNEGMLEASAYIAEHNHPRLWKLLAESALEALDFASAEKAFVNLGDYPGIQFVKRMATIGERMKQKAEVAAYFQRFDEAESIYREIDRKDLANELRIRLGDWFRVKALVQTGGGDDKMHMEACNKIGEYYADRFKWAKAASSFSQGKNLEKMIECYYRLEDYTSMEKGVEQISEGNPVLYDIGKMFEGVGMYKQAVRCFQKAGDVKAAIDTCVLLNQWEEAVKLAEAGGFAQIEGLLAKYAGHLLARGDKLQAVELYRKADKATEAARLLASIAEDVGKRQVDPLRAKKLHVLAALEVERYRKKALDLTLFTSKGKSAAATTAATLDTLMTADAESRAGGAGSKVLDNAWRGAEAYHYFLLAHRQLYKGEYDAAMKTAIRCAEFEDVLEARDIYSLIALTAYHASYFGICSRAFIKLETLPNVTEQFSDAIQTLALNIFMDQSPRNPANLPQCYTACLETGSSYNACSITGRALLDARSVMCKTCNHYMLEHELLRGGTKNCPLCHAAIPATNFSIREEEDEEE
jgi:WD repeat-containing protein 35